MGTLGKLGAAGRVLSGRGGGSLEAQLQLLLDRLAEFGRVAALPGLGHYGFTKDTVRRVASEGNSKNSPIEFSEDERITLLARCV
jgi:hypothetical protein